MSLLKVCAQICVLASIWAGVALPAQAQDYPARTITPSWCRWRPAPAWTLPDVAPFAEAANAPGFEVVSRHILFAPAATPKPIVDKLHAEMNKIMADPEIKQKIATLGLLPITPPSTAETATYLASERKKWGTLVRKLRLEGSQ